MSAAMKHPVPERVKPLFVTFVDSLTPGHSDAQPGCQKLQMTA